ncbi:hypothetical protein PCC9214_05366 [Planktothrix tepida]|uniref:Uncharacterized protein n=1 Tax=Planktothrix tepida PCC 9214 TaxID=671072 RepID=A0A1J1LJQ1_9CYAN|nr:hypothetical protein [Planktothrix tepida]CAD5985002.1 hypothetical protein PCC9214_05328 [Planktothrix tepida]CAD5985286.1 hypothetical protein PCC9214_05366 [Planktothrix tepida]CUR32124.1 conserved hypothetical protein [Planktothrix tepida PCC 9214]
MTNLNELEKLAITLDKADVNALLAEATDETMPKNFETAVKKLEVWLSKEGDRKERLKMFHIYPSELQHELGLTTLEFWYALFFLREQQKINFYEKGYLAVYPVRQPTGEDG